MKVEMQDPELDLAIRIFLKEGTCKNHGKWTESVRPYGCNLTQINCLVCRKELERIYDE